MLRRVTLFLFFAIVFGFSAGAEESTYPNKELLIEPEQLAGAADAKSWIVLDARERAKFDKEHVAGARWVDHDAWAKAFGDGTDADGWSKRIGSLGIGSDARVVVYDDNYAKNAARIWWLLRYWGVKDVRLLDGDWTAWAAKGLAVEKTDNAPAAVAFAAKALPERLATKAQLLKSLGDGSLQIVDARSEKEFCGIDKMNNKRAGAIPGAKQLEWNDLLEKDTHRFKSSAELRKLFDESGIKLDSPTATHCQSGGRASVMAFGLELMGAKNVSNYYASWAEWSSADDTPVAPGKPRKDK